MKREKIQLDKSLSALSNLHDKKITQFIYTNEVLFLQFNEVECFVGSIYKTFTLKFSEFDDINLDVYFEFYDIENDSFNNKGIVYFDEFIKNRDLLNYKYEFVDFYLGINKMLIKGAVLSNDGYIKDFNLYLECKCMEYIVE